MQKINCFTLRVNKGHISPYCKNIIELYIRICGADMRRYMLLQVNGALYNSSFLYIQMYTGRGNMF